MTKVAKHTRSLLDKPSFSNFAVPAELGVLRLLSTNPQLNNLPPYLFVINIIKYNINKILKKSHSFHGIHITVFFQCFDELFVTKIDLQT